MCPEFSASKQWFEQLAQKKNKNLSSVSILDAMNYCMWSMPDNNFYWKPIIGDFLCAGAFFQCEDGCGLIEVASL